MKNNIIYHIIFCIFICSCVKQADLETQNSHDSSILFQELKHKDESACITEDNKAGILCFASLGNTCKKIIPCTPVSSTAINAEQFFTQQELNDWMNTDYRNNTPFMIHMWEIGYFVHPDSIQ
jgi:hypothetical protein